MPSAVNQSPGGCQCGEATGEICLSISRGCSGGTLVGYVVTVTDHATGLVVASDSVTTNPSYSHCFDGLPAGTYDVVASKDGGSTLTWAGQVLASGATLNLTGTAVLYPFAGRRFAVKGCGGVALPGATITIGGVESATLTTDGAGQAYYFPSVLGTHTYSVAATKFSTSTGSWNQTTACATALISITMTPASGYSCCDSWSFANNSPWPVSSTLILTDSGGSTSFTHANCIGGVIVSRSMPGVSVTGATVTGPCTEGGSAAMPPFDIQTRTTSVRYSVGTSTASQFMPQVPNSLSGYHYRSGRAAPPAASQCFPLDTFQIWRYVTASLTTGGTEYQSISTTINSVSPLSITFTFGGNGLGPSPTDITGQPYSSSITISE